MAILAAAAVAILVAAVPAAAYPRPGRTERLSLGAARVPAGPFGGAFSPGASADGRYVAFLSADSNLVPGDTNLATDVFLYDRATDDLGLISVGTQGEMPDNGSIFAPRVTPDGRYVVFASLASNLVAGDTNSVLDIFRFDRETGVTERVSVSSDEAQANEESVYASSISPDGRYVAFTSLAWNLVPGDNNGALDVFVRDMEAGTTERVSVNSSEQESGVFESSVYASISADGRYVAFLSQATNFAAGDGILSDWDVFVRDRVAGDTELVSVASDGAHGSADSPPSLTPDGRYVAFQSSASNLVPADTNAAADAFVHDRQTGLTERVSVGTTGVEGDSGSHYPSISADGRYVAFVSLASNLVSGDGNGNYDVFVRDRETGATDRVSVASDGAEANHGSVDLWSPPISADGRYVAFTSLASNLVPGDDRTGEPQYYDVFVRDRGHPVGVGDLSAGVDGGRITASGWATFSGATLGSVEDPTGDHALAEQLGADLVGAGLIYRPEDEDLLVRLRLSRLPGTPPGEVPGLLYGMEFRLGEVRFEVRAVRAPAQSPPGVGQSFALYRCDPQCSHQVTLSGGIGTTGSEVLVSVPLAALQAEGGAHLGNVRAFTAIDDQTLVPLDSADLPDGTIPLRRVSLGIAPAGTPEGAVAFTAPATLVDGSFSGTVDVSTLPPGAYNLWARACLGLSCGAAFVRVAIGPTAVGVSSFTATRTRKGVALTWRTRADLHVLGFDLRRRTSGAPYRKLNGRLIAARGSSGGTIYRYLDRTAQSGSRYDYRLELVRRDGRRQLAGSVSVR